MSYVCVIFTKNVSSIGRKNGGRRYAGHRDTTLLGGLDGLGANKKTVGAGCAFVVILDRNRSLSMHCIVLASILARDGGRTQLKAYLSSSILHFSLRRMLLSTSPNRLQAFEVRVFRCYAADSGWVRPRTLEWSPRPRGTLPGRFKPHTRPSLLTLRTSCHCTISRNIKDNSVGTPWEAPFSQTQLRRFGYVSNLSWSWCSSQGDL